MLYLTETEGALCRVFVRNVVRRFQSSDWRGQAIRTIVLINSG